MKPCYINGVGCVSAQKTFDNSEFLDEISHYDTNVMPVVAPVYKEFIHPVAARRMAKGVKMGVVASKLALQEAGLEMPDAILTGTGMGCVRDSEKFLENIIKNEEQFLTPTSFIQSTHNTVGAAVALGLKCKAYNVSYVHAAVSFESALVDASLVFHEEDANHILVGGVEEMGDHTIKLFHLIKHLKAEPINNMDLLKASSQGTTTSEGAQFFVLSQQKQDSSYAQLKAVEMYNELDDSEVAQQLETFIQNNGLAITDIDAVILGNNGDAEFDPIYQSLQTGLFENTPQLAYKHLSGEYNTASAFGFWVGAKVLKTQQVPAVLKMNELSKPAYKNVLLYNQYRGKNHSFVLLGAC